VENGTAVLEREDAFPAIRSFAKRVPLRGSDAAYGRGAHQTLRVRSVPPCLNASAAHRLKIAVEYIVEDLCISGSASGITNRTICSCCVPWVVKVQ
jgi:hypothetical protein